MNKAILIGAPVALALGAGGFGLAYMGLVPIPGISPPVKKFKPSPDTPLQAVVVSFRDVARRIPPTAPKKPEPDKPPAPPVNQDRGERKLALLWNEMDPAQLRPIVEAWKDDELARVLLRMDEEQVAKLLMTFKPSRASALSRAMRLEASLRPPETATP